MSNLLKEYIRLALESAPSRLMLREPTLSADSTGYEKDHLHRPRQKRQDTEEEIAAHLKDLEVDEELQNFGPVPPTGYDPLTVPDPFVKGQYDNVTWSR